MESAKKDEETMEETNVIPFRRGTRRGQSSSPPSPSPSPSPSPLPIYEDVGPLCIADVQDVLDGLIDKGMMEKLANGGYALTEFGRKGGSLLVSAAILEAGKEKVDVDETVRLHAYMLGADGGVG